MIGYERPDEDPIVAEVRRAREEFAAEFGNDLHAIFEEMRRRQKLEPQKYAAPANQAVNSTPTKRAI